MIKRFILVFAFMAIGLVTSYAAQSAITGKVIALDDSNIQIAVEEEMPGWCRKGAVVKVADETGKLIVRQAKVSECAEQNITVSAKNTGKLKVGDQVTLRKGRVSSGC